MVHRYKKKKAAKNVPTAEEAEAAIRECARLGHFEDPPKRGAIAGGVLKGVKRPTLTLWLKGHRTLGAALEGLKNKRPVGRQTTMPRHLEAVVVRTMIECWECNASLARGELMRIYYAVAEAHGIRFKARPPTRARMLVRRRFKGLPDCMQMAWKKLAVSRKNRMLS